MNKGTPEGAVLSPILFVVHFDEVLWDLDAARAQQGTAAGLGVRIGGAPREGGPGAPGPPQHTTVVGIGLADDLAVVVENGV